MLFRSATDCNTHNTLDALDCISRQAAIDIVDDIRDCISVDGYWAFIERLKKTPSAQPELIRCHECKYYDGRPCGKVDWYNSADDYCSREKRREDE